MRTARKGFFSILDKRDIEGKLNNVRKQYPHRLLSEYGFRYNAQHTSSDGRASLAAMRFEAKMQADRHFLDFVV